MIYSILRWIGGVALHWFYSDIRITGRDRIPLGGPLLIAANHQNALVDSLIVGWIVRRPVTMTAKATLGDHLITGLMFKLLKVVALRRTRDEPEKTQSTPDRTRNDEAFEKIMNLLESEQAVLIFPEGKSHNEDHLEPLKTGLARLALRARTHRGISRIKILPIGLVFEDKSRPGTVVGAHIEEPIDMDLWPGEDHLALTEEIANRLRRAESTELLTEATTTGRIHDGLFQRTFIALAAWWGNITHRTAIRIARKIAVKQSTDADQPAMLTILFGVSLVLITYAIHVVLVGLLLHSFLLAVAYLASLLCGAYWAAFRQHRNPS